MTEDSKLMNIPNDRRLRDIPYFQDGAVLRVESKTPRKDPHTGVSVADLK